MRKEKNLKFERRNSELEDWNVPRETCFRMKEEVNFDELDLRADVNEGSETIVPYKAVTEHVM